VGFWSTLGKIGLATAGIAGTPFSGGTSLAATLPMIAGTAASSIASGIQANREKKNKNAADQAAFNLQERNAAENALQNRAGIDLQQRAFSQGAQTDAYKKALQSALAMNVQDAKISRPPGMNQFNFTGGLRPSALGEQGKLAAETMNKLAMEKLMNGEKFAPLPALERTAAPEYKNAGFWENLMGGIGAVGNAVSGAQSLGQQNDFQSKITKAIEGLSKPQLPSQPDLTAGRWT